MLSGFCSAKNCLEAATRAKGRIRIADEQELIAIESRLQRYPEAVKAILLTASHLHRPVDALSAADVLRLT